MTEEETKRFGHPRFYELVEAEAELHSRKAHDYASQADPLSNFRNVGAVTGLRPWQVGYVMIAVKFFRLVNIFTSGEDALNESPEDSLTDISVYSKLTRIMLEEERLLAQAQAEYLAQQEAAAAEAEAEAEEDGSS